MAQGVVNFLETQIPLRAGRPRTVGLILLGLAILACIIALGIFPGPIPADGWPFYVSSTVLFLAGCYTLFRSPKPEITPPPLNLRLIASLAVIVLAAAFMRYYRLGDIPFGTWWDEADISIVVRQILTDPEYRPVFVPSNDHALPFFAVAALFFNFLGVSTLALRSDTATFGVATAVVAFLLGRELYGNRFGLLMAFFFAVTRWHITFSRFAIYSVTLPFFQVLTLWLLMRAKRTGRIQDFAWAGWALGMGLSFHIAFRLFPLVVLVFVVYWAVTTWRARRAAIIANFLALTIAALLAAAPVIQYALLNPETYWGRSSTVSIFNHRDEPDLAKAIWSNTAEHLLMFNYRGDNNGRHNLPGEPMLDPLTGLLFVLGGALVISRPRHLPHILFILIFVLGLSAGILTLDFESPQASRAFGAVTAVIYFAALAAETLWRAIDRIGVSRPARRAINALIVIAAGGGILYSNAHTYFVRQAGDNAVWEQHNGVETLTAYQMLAVDPARTTLYASVFLNNHLVIQFLAPEAKNSTAIIPPIGLPVREPGDKPVAIFVDRANTWILEEARRYYPDAEYTTYTMPSGAPALYRVLISPEQIRRLQGLTASYWSGDSASGAPAITRTEPGIAAHWPDSAPLAAPFVAGWVGTVYAPRYGDYEFVLQSPADAVLWIDEQQIFNGSGEQSATLPLATGDHAIRLQARSGAGDIHLLWQPPDSETGETFSLGAIQPQWLYLTPPVFNHGLLGAYYPTADGSGPPAFQRIDPFLDAYFHIIPLGRPYTVEWAGQIQAPVDGEYTFGLWVNGQAQVWIDDQLVVNAPQPTELEEGKISLTAGRHKLIVNFLDNIGSSRIHLYWTLPGSADRQIVPTDALWPYPQP